MEKGGAQFADFDDEKVYADSWLLAQHEETRNFVVEFGKEEAQIAFDLSAENLEDLLDRPVANERPVRWINIWGPNQQLAIIDLLASRYKFSPRLHAIIRTAPEEYETHTVVKQSRFRPKYPKNDIEIGTKSIDLPRRNIAPQDALLNFSHYKLAEQMINYQSIDIGARFLCIGANWMHRRPKVQDQDDFDPDIVAEGKQGRLWSWLILCDDHTVLSLHEYPYSVKSPDELIATRANTLSVLSQLSNFGHDNADPISMQTVRQALKLDTAQAHEGIEGASLLFYYLFDDWRSVYSTVATYRNRLDGLQREILDDMTRNSTKSPNIRIIPRLHILGTQIRQAQHLYEGYKNLIQRILESQISSSSSTSNIDGISPTHRGIHISQSARQRFERLGDRIQLLILSETQEFLAEKDALINTYFNINAQKDSESAARLTRSATLLAKLSVLFLPVSLMTSYFSVQIADLQGIYTAKDYWYAFAVIMSISFLALFFFSRLLMLVTETLDGWMKAGSHAFARFLLRKRERRREGVDES